MTVVAPTPNPWTLGVLGDPAVAFTVYGTPGPQGSKSAGMRNGRVQMWESSQKVKPWRKAVVEAGKLSVGPNWTLLDGFLVVDMVFSMHKGTSIPKWKWWHHTTPDLDKLVRATGDALTGVAYVDDARVCAFRRLEKLYVGSPDPDALDREGAIVRVWPVPPAMIDTAKTNAKVRR